MTQVQKSVYLSDVMKALKFAQSFSLLDFVVGGFFMQALSMLTNSVDISSKIGLLADVVAQDRRLHPESRASLASREGNLKPLSLVTLLMWVSNIPKKMLDLYCMTAYRYVLHNT